MKKNKINSNINLLKLQGTIGGKNKIIESTINGLVIHINLNSATEYSSVVSNHKTLTPEKYTTIDFVKEDKGISKASKLKHRKSLSLSLSKEFLFENITDNLKGTVADFFEGKETIKNLTTKKTDPKTQILSHEIYHTPYTNNLDKLFIESKTLELIHNEITALSQEQNKDSSIKFSKQDKEAIYHAREILIRNLTNPPSMKELARMVAINDLKLKIGFHRFFNQTPYSVSLEYRLQEARKLLQTSDMNINEIAEHIGYKYAANFSTAFYKRFGIRPSDLMKSRKYYY